MRIGETIAKTAISKSTSSPSWNQKYVFTVSNPNMQILKVKLINKTKEFLKKKDMKLGYSEIRLNNLYQNVEKVVVVTLKGKSKWKFKNVKGTITLRLKPVGFGLQKSIPQSGTIYPKMQNNMQIKPQIRLPKIHGYTPKVQIQGYQTQNLQERLLQQQQQLYRQQQMLQQQQREIERRQKEQERLRMQRQQQFFGGPNLLHMTNQIIQNQRFPNNSNPIQQQPTNNFMNNQMNQMNQYPQVNNQMNNQVNNQMTNQMNNQMMQPNYNPNVTMNMMSNQNNTNTNGNQFYMYHQMHNQNNSGNKFNNFYNGNSQQ